MKPPKFIFQLLAIFLLTFVLTISWAIDNEGNYGIVTTQSTALNIREGRSTNTKIIGKAPKGSLLRILETRGSWYKVQLNDGKIGYASVDYIRIQPRIEQARKKTNQERRDIIPKFKDYPVNEIYKGKNHPLVLDSSFAKDYRTRLRNAIKYGKPSFAGRYIVTGWGCGSGGCNIGAIIDASTGRAYPFPATMASVWPLKPEYSEEAGQEKIYRLNSRLMILAGNLNEVDMDVIKFYEFKDNNFILIKTIPYGRLARHESDVSISTEHSIATGETLVQTSELPSSPTVEQPEVFVQLGHSDDVNAVVFSPDGKLVLSGSNDNTLKLWDVSSGRELRTFKGHSDNVNAVVFSPDGKLVLSGSHDGTLKLWEVHSGREIRSFKEDSYSGYVEAVAFSPDGRLALSGGRDGTIKLWEVHSGRKIRTFKGHSYYVEAVAFSPDGRLALSGSGDGSLKLWEVHSGQEIRSFNVGDNMTFSPDGRLALSGSKDDTLQLWEVRSGRKIRSFKGTSEGSNFKESSAVHALALSPDGRLALSGSMDGTLKLWEVHSGMEIRSFKGHSYNANAVAFSPDGRLALSGSRDGTLKLWEVHSGRYIRRFKGHSSPVNAVAFDGRLVLSGSRDGTLKLWEAHSGRYIRRFKGHSNDVNAVVFSPDGRLALSGSSDKTLKLWEVHSGREIHSFKEHSNDVNAVVFSPDGRLVLSGSRDETLKLWEVQSGQEIRSFKHSHDVNAVVFSPDGRLVLSGSREDNTMKLWELYSGRKIRRFKLQPEYLAIGAVAFSPDGRMVLSGSYDDYGEFSDHMLNLWEVDSGRKIRTFKHFYNVYAVAFSPDGRLALSGSSDNTLKLWEVHSGREIRSFKGHSSSVTAVAFSPDGRLALSGSWDSTTRLWNVKTGEEVAQMVGFEDGEWVTITPEGYYTASLNGGKYINVSIGNQVYGIDQYEAIYHRPDIVKLAIELGDSQQAIAQLSHGSAPVQIAQVQPPKVWFVTPKDGYKTHRDNVEVQVKTENVADKADAVSFFLNQRPVATIKGKRTRPTAAGAEVRVYTQKIPLFEGYNRIHAEVRGKAGAVQRTPLLSVVRKGVTKKRPDLYYLGIGVAEHPQVPLRFPAKDVTGLEKVLKQQQGKVYRRVVTKTLTNQQATRGNLINAISTFFEPAKRGDIAILFISGHGMNTKMGYHFVTYDANVDQLAATGASWQIFNAINDLKAHVLLFADTCHAGNITGNSKWKDNSQADPSQFLRQANLHNVVVLASSSGGDYSIENPEWGHGAFSKALIDGLGGEAAYKKGVVKLSFLQDYVRDTVRELTDNAQTPTIPKISGSGEFFELVLAKK